MKPTIMSAVRSVFVVLVLMFVSSAMQAEPIKGSFNLPFEAYWGDVRMPAGHYTFHLDTTGVVPVVLHLGLTSKFVKYGDPETLKSTARSQLVMVHAGDKWLVNAVYIAEINKAFWFKVPEKYSVSHRVIADSKPAGNLDFIPVTVNGK